MCVAPPNTFVDMLKYLHTIVKNNCLKPVAKQIILNQNKNEFFINKIKSKSKKFKGEKFPNVSIIGGDPCQNLTKVS